jgi:hypothetical protein
MWSSTIIFLPAEMALIDFHALPGTIRNDINASGIGAIKTQSVLTV